MTDLVDIDDTVIGALDAMTVVIPRRSNATTTASITSLGTGRPAHLSLAGHRGAVLELADGVLTLGGGPRPPNTGGADGAQLLRHQRPRPRGRPAARHGWDVRLLHWRLGVLLAGVDDLTMRRAGAVRLRSWLVPPDHRSRSGCWKKSCPAAATPGAAGQDFFQQPE